MDNLIKLLQYASTKNPIVLDPALNKEEYIKIDLSVDNEPLKKIDTSNSSIFSSYIDPLLSSKNAKVGVGGYNERRSIYKRSQIFSQSGPSDAEERDIHLGIDLWTVAGTKVIAPIAGFVHSFANNKGLGNYGPTLILTHKFENIEFYTLYGHLSQRSLERYREGNYFAAGDEIGKLGQAEENGDYPPHLHFQIIKDLKGNTGDFPGVAAMSERATALDNCPDPNHLLAIGAL